MDDTPLNADAEPSNIGLRMLSLAGRVARLQAQGLSLEEAIARVTAPESAAEYLARNQQALDEITERMMSPEYLERFAAANGEPDPQVRAQKLADLKRENFATLDIEALHRTIRARNRQMKAEGVLPPDAPT